jgi:hypothetical protein
MFLTPFNAVGLFLIWVFLNSLRSEKIKIEPRLTDPIRGVESYSMTVWSPWAAFFGGLTFGSFLGIFIVAFSFGFHPPMSRVLLVWGGVGALSVVFAIWTRIQITSGKRDLVIDRHSGVVKIPAMHKRKIPMSIPFREIRAFESRTTTKGSGDDSKTEHLLFLVTKDGTEMLLKREISQARAEALAGSLEERIGIGIAV